MPLLRVEFESSKKVSSNRPGIRSIISRGPPPPTRQDVVSVERGEDDSFGRQRRRLDRSSASDLRRFRLAAPRRLPRRQAVRRQSHRMLQTTGNRR